MVCPEDWMNIMDHFETSKKKIKHQNRNGEDTFTGGTIEKVKISKAFKKELKWFNKESPYVKYDIKIEGDYLVIPTSSIIKIIELVTNRITHHVEELVKDVKMKHKLDAILLVGGFTKSPILIKSIKDCVGSSIPVFTPPDSCLLYTSPSPRDS